MTNLTCRLAGLKSQALVDTADNGPWRHLPKPDGSPANVVGASIRRDFDVTLRNFTKRSAKNDHAPSSPAWAALVSTCTARARLGEKKRGRKKWPPTQPSRCRGQKMLQKAVADAPTQKRRPYKISKLSMKSPVRPSVSPTFKTPMLTSRLLVDPPSISPVISTRSSRSQPKVP